MPDRITIVSEILNAKASAQDNVRRKYIKKLSDYTKRDTIVYFTAYNTGKTSAIPPSSISIMNEDIQGFMTALHGLKNNKLDLFIHSPGGSAETVEQIVSYLRSKYDHIRAIVPQNAMSAATMLACACDEILMAKHSALGPIDPQITFPTPTGLFTAPAQSLLKEFEQAKREIIKDPALLPLWIHKINTLPHGILDICKNTTELAIMKVQIWLETFMFSGDKNGYKKSNDIANWLGIADNHKTHGRPISMKTLTDMGLKIIPIENDQNLQEHILSVFHSCIVTMEVTSCVKFIENQNGKGTYFNFTK